MKNDLVPVAVKADTQVDEDTNSQELFLAPYMKKAISNDGLFFVQLHYARVLLFDSVPLQLEN